MYTARKRRKPAQKKGVQPAAAAESTKSNPSKRHRDRLNSELERLAGALPFPQDVSSSLDKLSVLRLSVSFLRTKSFFSVTLKNQLLPGAVERSGVVPEGELLLQALNGFVLVVTAEGTVFFCSHSIQDYLGFHQTDVMHHSVLELIHSEDQQQFRSNLHWALSPPAGPADPSTDGGAAASSSCPVSYSPDRLPPENSSFLERGFVCRFRCLLDNSSGFLALNIQGRLKFLHGQNRQRSAGKGSAPPQLALFAIATPLQSPAILEIRTRNMIFRTKHKLDFTPMSCDAKGKIVLGYTEAELRVRGSGYQFIHAADMLYCAENHVRKEELRDAQRTCGPCRWAQHDVWNTQPLRRWGVKRPTYLVNRMTRLVSVSDTEPVAAVMKTGESGLTVFRLLTKASRWRWVQANARLVYRSSEPDSIISTQRPLGDEEGGEHLRKRSLHLPFTFATGEAALYQTGFPLHGFPESKKGKPDGTGSDDLDPKSLLGALMSQDESVYAARPDAASRGGEPGRCDGRAAGDAPPLAALDALSLDGAEPCSNSELFGALEDLGLDAGDLELLLLDEGRIQVEPGHAPALADLLADNEILSYVHDSLEPRAAVPEAPPTTRPSQQMLQKADSASQPGAVGAGADWLVTGGGRRHTHTALGAAPGPHSTRLQVHQPGSQLTTNATPELCRYQTLELDRLLGLTGLRLGFNSAALDSAHSELQSGLLTLRPGGDLPDGLSGRQDPHQSGFIL